MTAIRFQFFDPNGVPLLNESGGMLSAPESTTALEDADGILADLASAPDAPPGLRVRLWKDVPLVGSLSSLGPPHAEVTL